MNCEVKTFAIQNDLCRRAGISATWQSANNVTVFPSQMVKSTQRDVPSPYLAADSANIYQVRQEVALFHPIIRRLVNETSGIFINLQNTVNSITVSEYRKDLQQFSIQYRSIIRACLENLRDEVLRVNGTEKEELENYVTIFYSVECIWHLCEILFIDNIPGYVVIKYLLEWVRFHFPKYERKAARLLTNELIGIESDPEYWETVIGSLMQGQIKVGRALLSLHSNSHTNTFKLADQALKSMPTYDIYEGISVSQFNLRWKNWIVETQSKIDAKLFTTNKKVDLIMRLVVGEELAWNEVSIQCGNWYEYLAAWLFYTKPTVKSFELGEYAQESISKVGATLHHLDRVLLAAMEGDVVILKEVQNMRENGWFVTHLVDLLHHSGQLEKWQSGENTSSKLRESFLLDYGILLMSHNSLWQIGLSYLDHCPKYGLHTIEVLLSKVPLTSEAKTNKIMKEAQIRDLPNIIQSISKIQGIDSLRKGRVGNALIWALKSQDANFCTYLSGEFLKDYIRTGILPNEDLLNHLGSCMVASDRLMFLGKYFEFHRLYRMSKFKEAGVTLISIITSKFTPKYFWSTLFLDALNLLESNEIIFSSNDTFNLLNSLEEHADLPELKDKMNLIRMGVARNLTRALTSDAKSSQLV